MANLLRASRDANNGGYVSLLYDTVIDTETDGVVAVSVDGNDYIDTNFIDQNLWSIHFSDDPSLFNGVTAYAFSLINNGGLTFVGGEDTPDFSGNLVPLVNIVSVVKTGSNTVRVHIDQPIVSVDDPDYPATFDNMVAYPDWGVRVNDNPATLDSAVAGDSFFDLSYGSDVTVGDPWVFTINVGGSGSFGYSFGSLIAGVSGTVEAGGGITLVTSTISSGSTFPPVSTSAIDTTGANLIVVAITWYPPNGDPVASDLSDSKGNVWTPLTKQVNSASFDASWLFYCANPIVGSGHTFSLGSQNYIAVAVMAFGGAASSPFEAESGSKASGTTRQPGSLTPAENGCLIVTGLGYGAASSISIDSGFSSPLNDNYVPPPMGIGMSYLVQTTAGAINPTWTAGSASQMAATMAIFKPPSALAANAYFYLLLTGSGANV